MIKKHKNQRKPLIPYTTFHNNIYKEVIKQDDAGNNTQRKWTVAFLYRFLRIKEKKVKNHLEGKNSKQSQD